MNWFAQSSRKPRFHLLIRFVCGIAGIVRRSTTAFPADVIEGMTQAVAHRGPDGAGCVFLDVSDRSAAANTVASAAEWNVALGHRRLSIIDLSDAGRQPMSYDDRLWITYNGEVYNYVELRRELEGLGRRFRSQSDTEVILAAYDAWGTDCFSRFHGMWALAIVDPRRRVVVLSRDRLGIKPLYLVRCADFLAFASEIKQFRRLAPLAWRPDDATLRNYLLTGYERDQATFFNGVESSPAGCYQELDPTTLSSPSPVAYWFPERITPTVTDRREAASRFRSAFERSVRLHQRSDVAVGCALSGGLDSGVVAACVARQRPTDGPPFKTFSVTFPGDAVDERPFVDDVLARIRAEPYFTTPTADGLLHDLDPFIGAHDEPVGSLSQYSGYVLARMMRAENVPVTLNGQGGDEVFAGYWQSYFLYLRELWTTGRIGASVGEWLGSLFPGGNPELVRQTPLMWRRYRARRSSSAVLDLPSLAEGAAAGSGRVGDVLGMNAHERRIHEIRTFYLPRLLKWDDRNFMAFSVEGRYPFLDHGLIETVLSFAAETLYRRGWTKEPLRAGFADLLPQSILRRRTKFGFELPHGAWIRGPLRPAIDAWLGGDSPLWAFVEPREVRALDACACRAVDEHDESVQALVRMFIADRWLRLYFS